MGPLPRVPAVIIPLAEVAHVSSFAAGRALVSVATVARPLRMLRWHDSRTFCRGALRKENPVYFSHILYCVRLLAERFPRQDLNRSLWW